MVFSVFVSLLEQCVGEEAVGLWLETERWAWRQLYQHLPSGGGDRPVDDDAALVALAALSPGDADTQLLIGLLDLVSHRLQLSKDVELREKPKQIVSQVFFF